MITLSQGTGPLTARWIYCGTAVAQFAHGFAEGERAQLGSSLKWNLIHHPPAVARQTHLNLRGSDNERHFSHPNKVSDLF